MFAFRCVKMLVDAICEDASPSRLAWGIAWGVPIGLVPKDNLIAAVLFVVVCSLRVNLAAAIASAFVFSWVGVASDPITHWLGTALLTAPSLESFWTTLYNLPVMPWTSFNNTVVLGNLLLGLLLLYPVRRVAEPLAARLLPPISDRLNRMRMAQWMTRTELAVKVGRA